MDIHPGLFQYFASVDKIPIQWDFRGGSQPQPQPTTTQQNANTPPPDPTTAYQPPPIQLTNNRQPPLTRARRQVVRAPAPVPPRPSTLPRHLHPMLQAPPLHP